MALRVMFASFVSGALLATAVSTSQPDCRAGGSGACDANVDSTRPQSTKTHAHNVLLQNKKTISSLYRKEHDSSVTSGYDVNTDHGLMYADDNSKQVLDIYTPDVAPPSSGWPLVIAIHGVGGTEKTFKITCQYIAQGGRSCMSIDYKNIGYDDAQDGFDACSSKAIDWARRSDIASTYNIDTSRIILLGQSRGGFIVGDLAFREDYDQTRIAGAIILNGLKKINYEYLEARAAADVPLLILSTEDDNVVSPTWSSEVEELMQSKGGDVTHIKYPAGGHNLKKAVASLYEHINDFLLKFDPSPPLVGSTDKWLSVCKEFCECFDAGEPVTVADLSACEAEADKHGHRYIMFYDQLCATTLTCDYSGWSTKGDHPASGTPWQVYWRLHSSAPTPPPAPTPPTPSTTTAAPTTTEAAPTTPAPEGISYYDEDGWPYGFDGKKIKCRTDCLSDTRDWDKKCGFSKCTDCAECV